MAKKFVRGFCYSALILILIGETVFAYQNETYIKRRLGGLWKKYSPLFSNLCGVTAVEIRSLPQGAVLLSYNADVPLVTASVTKLFTSAAALYYLGPGYRFFTEIRGSLPQRGKISSSIMLYSYGNPLWNYEDMKACLSRVVELRNIKTIEGRVVVSMSSFYPGVEHLCIDDRCDRPYNPVVSPVSLDFNTLRVIATPTKVGKPAKVILDPPVGFLIVKNRVVTTRSSKNTGLYATLSEDGTTLIVRGKVSARHGRAVSVETNIPGPTAFIEQMVTDELGDLGVKVFRKSVPPGDHVLARCYGLSVADAIKEMNNDSNNFVAETINRLVGLKAYGTPGTNLKGLRAIEGYLQGIGIPRRDLHLTSGSGLSRDNRATARAFGILLTRLYHDKNSQIFLNSLAKNGRDGTLKRYWRGDDIVVMAKTGTLDGVVGLSGYVLYDSNDDPFIVTVLCNECSQRWKVRRLVESFVREAVQVFREKRMRSQSPRAIKPIIGGKIRLEINRTATT